MMQQFYPQVQHNFKYELNKDMNFSSAHFIPDERAGDCSRVHGHTYFVNITIGGNELDELGFLVNFSVLKKLIHGTFDHRTLNDFIKVPSTENVAETIFKVIQKYLGHTEHQPQCLQVIVRETPTSYVIYRGGVQ